MPKPQPHTKVDEMFSVHRHQSYILGCFPHSHTPGNNLSSVLAAYIMLDVVDFIKERGGNPDQIRQSQKRRYAPEEAVDEVIALYDDHRKSVPSTSRALASKQWRC